MADIAERIDFLASSTHRVEVLRALDDDGPLSRRTIQDRVDASRSTVKRALDGLAELDWVAETDDGYVITPVGSAVLSAYAEFADAVRTAESVAPVFRWLPETDPDFDLRSLDDAEVVVASEGDPYAPAIHQTELMQSVKRFRGLFPSIDREGIRRVHDRIVAGHLEAEIVVSADVAATIREEPYADLFREPLATGRLSVSVVDEVPFHLGLPDDGSVQVGVEDDEGLPRALLDTGDEAVRRWGKRRYEEYRSAATPLSEDDFT
ncbi:transcriptional regulator [Halobacteriales archaeon QS_1_68_20]|nr:MAG: transcriptional regulator [Halobacteriales archaeon QS_1_68_20]